MNLSPLQAQSPKSDPMGENFDYAEAFESLDLEAVKRDINSVLTTSQDWWSADYGNYRPFFIRMALTVLEPIGKGMGTVALIAGATL